MGRMTLLGVAAFLASTCSGTADVGYRVEVRVVGSASAFSLRHLAVQGVTFPNPAADVETGLLVTSVELCTDDRERFLSTPFTIELSDGSAPKTTVAFERVACRLSPDEIGETEHNQLLLHDDGTLSTDFGTEPHIKAACDSPQPNNYRPCMTVQF